MRSSLPRCVVLIPLVLPTAAVAARNYGEAGCGVGSTFVKKEGAQPLAAVINVTAPSVSAASLGLLMAGGQPLAIVFMEQSGLQAATAVAMAAPHPATAMSIGTSNCQPDNEGQAAFTQQGHFMFENYAEISKEVAQGTGPHLNTLLGMLGCHTTAHPTLSKIAQVQHQHIFAAPGAIAALESLRNTFARDSASTQSCPELARTTTQGTIQ